MNNNEMTLRRLLWLNHASDHILYGDDGEMACNTCFIDFKRDTVEQISNKFEKIQMIKIQFAHQIYWIISFKNYINLTIQNINDEN